MTREEDRIYEAAVLYTTMSNDHNLARLMDAIDDLPMQQWPDEYCQHKKKRDAKKEKEALKGVLPFIVHRGPKPEPGDAAMPDKLIDMETGERKAMDE